MCGIVCGLSEEALGSSIIQALAHLEYRGYDSAGIATLDDVSVSRLRVVGKVSELRNAFDVTPLAGHCALSHTRWATHGKASEINAHPHLSHDDIVVVHNGIIDNFELIKQSLLEAQYSFTSETDSEVIAHAIHHLLSQGQSMQEALQSCLDWFDGHYSFCVASQQNPHQLWAVCHGSPLVIGQSASGTFVASDMVAMASLTQNYQILEENDIASLTLSEIVIVNQGRTMVRDVRQLDIQGHCSGKGQYRHFMLKEIYEQPEVLQQTLMGRLPSESLPDYFGQEEVLSALQSIHSVHIVACGTSYHAGVVAKYWFEERLGIHCQVEVASEYRYRSPVVRANTLFLTLSQSGETADTLAALNKAKILGYAKTLTICNVANSALARASDLVIYTRVGPEIGVASTKAFTSQLTVLGLVIEGLVKRVSQEDSSSHFQSLIPSIRQVLSLDQHIESVANELADKKSALFLGRHSEYPIAIEGALKLKEISYIHAEAYPAGELKHGPLALVDENMPVVVLAPKTDLMPKILANVQEVAARGGKLIIITDCPERFESNLGATFIPMPSCESRLLHPILYTIPLQLLAYHVALMRGTDIDQPRNLAKSVTVE